MPSDFLLKQLRVTSCEHENGYFASSVPHVAHGKTCLVMIWNSFVNDKKGHVFFVVFRLNK